MGELGPFLHAHIQFACWHILFGHQPGFAPATGQRIGVSEVLTYLGGVAAAAYLVAEHVHGTLGLTGQGIGEAEVGGRDCALVGIEDRDGLVEARSTGIGQRQRQRGTRAVVAQFDGFVIGGRGRGEAACLEIGIARRGAVGRIARFGLDRAFGEGNGL